MNLSAPKYFIVEKADIGWIRTTVCTAIALIAFAGLIYLVLPGWEAPPMGGAALMTAAGIAWGVYSLGGRGVANPIAVTGDNFLRNVPMVLLISLGALPHLNVSFKGTFLAFLSGAVTSGLGYVVWYAALRDLTATRAASVQLLVPLGRCYFPLGADQPAPRRLLHYDYRRGGVDFFDFGGLGVHWKIKGRQSARRFAVVHHHIAPHRPDFKTGITKGPRSRRTDAGSNPS